MPQPIRNTGEMLSGGYRYGYQGSEADDEVKGEGNSYTTFFRELDPRIGRWLSIDPLTSDLPWQSPYCSMDNNPIAHIDPMGNKIGVGKKMDVEKGNPGEFTGVKYTIATKGDGTETLVNTPEYNDYLKKYNDYQVYRTKAENHNAKIEEKIAVINSGLNGWEVEYKDGFLVPKGDVTRQQAFSGGELDMYVWKSIKSWRTMTISATESETYIVAGGTRSNPNAYAINISSFNNLYVHGAQGKAIARSQLAGIFADFKSGSKKSFKAQIVEFNRANPPVRLNIDMELYNKSTGLIIQYNDENGQPIVSYNIKKGTWR